MNGIHWILPVALGCFALAAFLPVVADNVVLLAIPLGVAHSAVGWIRRPRSWRLSRAVRSLRQPFAARVLRVIETRTVEWDAGTPTVYLVCRTHAEEAVLRTHLDEIRAEIARAAGDWRVRAGYMSATLLWPVSRQAVDQEGGWVGFDRNVPPPDSRSAAT